MHFVLPSLPYDRDALEPWISAETLDYHHGRHHRAYVTRTNALVVAAGLEQRSLLDVIRRAEPGPLRDNAAQLWNHSFFWECLSPESEPPTGQLARLIEARFGSHEGMITEFCAQSADHFASGWTWLLLDDGALRITTLHDGDSPALHAGMVPLFTLDLWEHAYYIDHRNARPDYIAAVMKHLVNWTFVAMNLDGEGLSRGDQD